MSEENSLELKQLEYIKLAEATLEKAAPAVEALTEAAGELQKTASAMIRAGMVYNVSESDLVEALRHPANALRLVRKVAEYIETKVKTASVQPTRSSESPSKPIPPAQKYTRDNRVATKADQAFTSALSSYVK